MALPVVVVVVVVILPATPRDRHFGIWCPFFEVFWQYEWFMNFIYIYIYSRYTCLVVSSDYLMLF